jgi:hypothetical protein
MSDSHEDGSSKNLRNVGKLLPVLQDAKTQKTATFMPAGVRTWGPTFRTCFLLQYLFEFLTSTCSVRHWLTRRWNPSQQLRQSMKMVSGLREEGCWHSDIAYVYQVCSTMVVARTAFSAKLQLLDITSRENIQRVARWESWSWGSCGC